MKTILVPTDFSKAANHSLNYAVALAKLSKAKLVLFHAFHVPIPAGDVPAMLVTPSDIVKAHLKNLHILEKKVKTKAPGLRTSCVAREGFLADEVAEVAREQQADLIVMGITGSSKLGEALIGSNAVSTMRQSPVPVIIVPARAKFKNIKKIALAFDYKAVKNKASLKVLFELIDLFQAKLLVVNVIKKDDAGSFKKAVAGIQMEQLLSKINHSLHFPVNEHVVEGIHEFVGDTGAGLLTVIPHQHGLFHRMLQKSISKKLAFHTDVPLLALPEQKEKPARKKGT